MRPAAAAPPPCGDRIGGRRRRRSGGGGVVCWRRQPARAGCAPRRGCARLDPAYRLLWATGKPEPREAVTEELTTRCEGTRKASSPCGPGDAPGLPGAGRLPRERPRRRRPTRARRRVTPAHDPDPQPLLPGLRRPTTAAWPTDPLPLSESDRFMACEEDSLADVKGVCSSLFLCVRTPNRLVRMLLWEATSTQRIRRCPLIVSHSPCWCARA